MATFKGTAGNDNLVGTINDDRFRLYQGGDDTADGDDGNDRFMMRDTFTGSDSLTGGDGFDTLVLDGDYNAGVVFLSNTISGIEAFRLKGGFDYNFLFFDDGVAAGETLIINGGRLGAGDQLFHQGGSETDGHFQVRGGAGDDLIAGGALSDRFYLRKGGNDTVSGGDDDDTFYMVGALNTLDAINGDSILSTTGDNDAVVLSHSYTGGNALTFASFTIRNIETLSLGGGHSYEIFTHQDTVAAGASMLVDGGALGATDVLDIDFTADSDGVYSVQGGDGNDAMVAGGGTNTMRGGGGNDSISAGSGTNVMEGQAGADSITCLAANTDTLVYSTASDSNSSVMDVITGLSFDTDKFDVDVTITGVGNAFASPVNAATFDADMGTILTDYVCSVVNVTGGDLIGKAFLVINADTGDGFQYVAGDYVIEVTGYTGTPDASDFI
jgi:Ca2+-binding RTX toxin-like protein